MRRVVPVLLTLSVSLLTACSYVTDFVVVNESVNPVEARYKLGKTTLDPFVASGKPALLAASQLNASERQWRELSPAQYSFDRESHWVTVRLMPGEALRVTRQKDWGVGVIVEIRFPIEEIRVRGAGGEIALSGDQVYKSCLPQSDTLCSLMTYR